MRFLTLTLFLTMFVASPAPAPAQTNLTPPQIQNIRVSQRPGTMFVDVLYNLVDPDSTNIYIIAEFSADGGATYGLPIYSLSGDVGLVRPGSNRHLVWNAWNDWAGNYTTNAKLRLTADDSFSAVPPPPTNAPGPNLVWISPGTFNMQRMDPPRNVYISRGFWMGRFEVTQGEYQALMGNNPSGHQGNTNLPVEGVTWYQANNYCNQLTARERAAGRFDTNWIYRLPTEAEWEYAARAGTTTDFPFGNDPNYTRLQAYAWYVSNSGGHSQPVGSKVPNQWGLFDMMGNVWEWCGDYSNNLQPGNFTDPSGPNSGSEKIWRGGAYDEGPSNLGYSRYHYSLDYAYSDLGFRVVLAPNP